MCNFRENFGFREIFGVRENFRKIFGVRENFRKNFCFCKNVKDFCENFCENGNFRETKFSEILQKLAHFCMIFAFLRKYK
jgi:hypothetical protein